MISNNLIKGDYSKDHRGVITYFNDFDMNNIKRFYYIDLSNIELIRAWQGHRKETKWYHVLKGDLNVNLIVPEIWGSNQYFTQKKLVLCSRNNEILKITPGTITGFKAVKASTRLMVFSDQILRKSLEDDYRFDIDYWNFKL